MKQVKESELSLTKKLALNLIHLIYAASDIMIQLKDVYCLNDNANVYYGDNFRSTTIPAYCGCQQRDCKINPIVRKYKNLIQEFDTLWPRLGYTILL